MRTDREVLEGSEFFFAKIILKLAVDDVDILEPEVTSSNPGLIGHHEEIEIEILQKLESLQRVGEILDVLNLGEVVLVDDESSISIEEYGFPRFNLLNPR